MEAYFECGLEDGSGESIDDGGGLIWCAADFARKSAAAVPGVQCVASGAGRWASGRSEAAREARSRDARERGGVVGDERTIHCDSSTTSFGVRADFFRLPRLPVPLPVLSLESVRATPGLRIAPPSEPPSDLDFVEPILTPSPTSGFSEPSCAPPKNPPPPRCLHPPWSVAEGIVSVGGGDGVRWCSASHASRDRHGWSARSTPRVCGGVENERERRCPD